MIPRRDVIEGLFKTGMAALGSRMLGNPQIQQDQPPKPGAITEHALPSIPMEPWTLTVVEINYPAGSCSCPHNVPGFVVGYVLQGEVRFRSKGRAEKTYRAGQVFYEPPDSTHLVSTNASSQHPARILTLRFVKSSTARTTA